MKLPSVVAYRLACLFIWLGCCLPSALLAQSASGEKPYKYGFWTGLAYNWIGFEPYNSGGFAPVFGAEYRIKETGVYLSLLAGPAPVQKGNYPSSHLNKKGVNGEFGLTVQYFPIGRLSGQLSQWYFGGDLRFGRQAFSYPVNYTDYYGVQHAYTYERKMNWTKILVRCGWRSGQGRFFVDLGLPMGIQTGKTSEKSPQTFSYRATDFVVSPTLSAGFHF